MSDDTSTAASARLGHLPPLGLAAARLEHGLSAFVDDLLDRRFGLRRRHWQLLRWVAERTAPRVEVFVAEAAVLHTDAEARQIVDDLVERGWVVRGDAGELALSAAGRPGFEAMVLAQETTWDVVLEGVEESAYVATVTAMTTMADNLERAVAAGPRAGR